MFSSTFSKGAFQILLPLTVARSGQSCCSQRNEWLEYWVTSSQFSKISFCSAEGTRPLNEEEEGTVPAGGGGAPVVVSAGLLHEVSFAADDP